MAKMIKFDLSIGGSKVKSFEELQDNLHVDLLPYLKTGRLVKWFLSRELADKAEMTQAIDVNQSDLALMVALCEVLELEADEDILENLLPDDDEWMQRLWAWADDQGIGNLEWEKYDWKGLPREKSKLRQLTKLDLSSNQLTSLPPEIGNLTQLTRLDLWSNQLTSLPPEIGNLTKLTILDIGGNKFSDTHLADMKRWLPHCSFL